MPWKKGNRLRLVSEQEASPTILVIYREIKESLGLPFVPMLYQAYAGFPSFLEMHWQRFRAIVGSRQFLELGDRLRADAYTRAHNYFNIPDLCAPIQGLSFSPGAKQELTETTEEFYYADPLLLLIAASQGRAFDGQIGTSAIAAQPTIHPQFETKPVLVEEESASPEVVRIFEEMKRATGLPIVTSDFRALARWPDFLRTYWSLLQPLLASPLYLECQYRVSDTAWGLVREFPGPFELTVAQLSEAGMNEDDIASVVRLTQAFTRGLSGSTLNISMVKIGLEGGNRPKQLPEEKTADASKPSTSPIRAA